MQGDTGASKPARASNAASACTRGVHSPDGSPTISLRPKWWRTRLVGRVSMDLITVDLTHVPQAGMGSEVTLWGRAPGGAVLPIDEVAHAGGTVGYELMCALARRVPVVVDAD